MRVLIESLLFRTIVLTTLIIVATLFATAQQPINGEYAKINHPTSNKEADYEKAKEPDSGISAEGWTAIFTAILAVVTFFLAIFTYLLYSTAFRQAREARVFFLQEKRHWIGPPAISVIRREDGVFVFELILENIGKTVATGVHMGAEVFIDVNASSTSDIVRVQPAWAANVI